MLPKDISPASFRGVRFLVPSDTAEIGRNAIRHAYPDANFHYLEDNGLHPPEFKITAILNGPGLVGQFRALRAALAKPGPGLLKHPYWGNQFVMVDGKARIKREDRDAGIIELDIPFSVTGPPAFPGAVSGVAAFVTGLVTSALTRLFNDFSDKYGSPITPNSSIAVGEAIGTVGDALDSRFGSAGNTAHDISVRKTEYAIDGDKLGTALGNVMSEIRDASDLYDATRLVNGFDAVADAAAGIINSAELITPDTIDRAWRRETLTLIGATVEAMAFFGMAEGMASRDYTTADDVDRDHEILSDLLERLQERELGSNTHPDLLDVFRATSEVLSEARVRRPRVVAIETEPVPASVLAYELYESDANAPLLVTLNILQPPILMTGSVNALTERD